MSRARVRLKLLTWRPEVVIPLLTEEGTKGWCRVRLSRLDHPCPSCPGGEQTPTFLERDEALSW